MKINLHLKIILLVECSVVEHFKVKDVLGTVF